MIRSAFAALIALATTADAQSDDWRDEIGDILSAYQSAIDDGDGAEFLMDHEHPDVLAYTASQIGTDADGYRAYVIDSARAAADQSTQTYQFFDQSAVFGVFGNDPWAHVAIRVTATQGTDQAALDACYSLLFYREDGETYMSTVQDGVFRDFLVAVKPRLGGVLATAPVTCDDP